MTSILLLEDERGLGMSLNATLIDEFGENVVWVKSLAEAREADARHGPFDAYLLDGTVLDGTSIGFVKELVTHRPKARIIAMSTNPDLLDRQMAAGATCQCSKLDLFEEGMRGIIEV